MDDALDRQKDRIVSEFETSVEAVRAGTIFAHDAKAYKKWRRDKGKSQSHSLDDASLERAIMNIAHTFPDNVTRVSA